MSSMQITDNEILARLPIDQQVAIQKAGRHIDLDPGRILHRLGEPTKSYFFPLTGVVSLTVPVKDGQTVEVGLVGREGIVGVSALLGNDRQDLEAMAQVRGVAVELPLSATNGSISDALRALGARYSTSLMMEMAQTAACNRLHSVEQRTARWLLQAGDHAVTNDLQLTHEFLAMMLAVRRASVTVVVGVFARAGLIVAKRGRISLADREGLSELACDCYRIIRATAPKYD
jgi:CRP-like cAMP-binding protein